MATGASLSKYGADVPGMPGYKYLLAYDAQGNYTGTLGLC